jgi:hypothetical protein
MILKTFLRKKIAKKWQFFCSKSCFFCKDWIVAQVTKKNANFFAESRQKSPKLYLPKSLKSLAVSIQQQKNFICESGSSASEANTMNNHATPQTRDR